MFLFAGPYRPLKFPTLISRITQTHIQCGLLFFRTSATARAAPRFLHETAMLPPLAYSVCVDTLLRLSGADKDIGTVLHVHFADEEGDPYAVALAARLNAYVAGRDSDFVVLNAEGYRGYVPLDEMVWTLTTAAPWDGEGSVYSVSVAGDSEAGDGVIDEDGFQTVRKGKSKKKRTAAKQDQRAGRGILPPNALPTVDPLPDGQLGLSFSVYEPSTLATQLGIPVSLLPLLGAFLGNDFTGASGSDDTGPPPATTAEIRAKGRQANLQRLFFERGLTHGQRITRVAGTLSGILATAFGGGAGSSGGARKRGKKQTIGSVMELIDAAVTGLLVRPLDTFATGEREAVVERIAEATLQYAIPKVDENGVSASVQGYDVGEDDVGLRWVSDACPLHAPEACPLVNVLSGLIRARDAALEDDEPGVREDDPLEQVRERYVAAYRQGVLDPHILDVAQTATMWSRMFLEDPDKETVQRSVGRPIRMWTYAVLDAGIGLPSVPEPELDDEKEVDEDDDELVDVVEESDSESDEGGGPDPLARLRGALKELDGTDQDADGQLPSAFSTFTALQNSRPKVITEYVRRGTRVANEEIIVSPLAELLKGAGIPYDPAVPPQLWSAETRRALLLHALASNQPAVSSVPDKDLVGVLAVRWVVRTMHLRAQESPGVKERILERWTQAEAKAILASFFSEQHTSASQPSSEVDEPALPLDRHIQLVTQVSTAVDAIEQLAQVLLLSSASSITSPARRFSGSRCHALLSGRVPLPPGVPEEKVWAACLDGLENAYTVLPQKKKDKKAKSKVAAQPVAKAASRGGAKGGSLFGLLADAEA